MQTTDGAILQWAEIKWYRIGKISQIVRLSGMYLRKVGGAAASCVPILHLLSQSSLIHICKFSCRAVTS